MRGSAPTGTVTLLFTDIEGSTRLLERIGDAYGDVLAAHHVILRAAIEWAGGYEVDTAGDAFFAAFERPADAVDCARRAQAALAAHTWPDGVEVHVRMGIHTGTPEWRDGAYLGMDVHRAARVMAAAHGGQVLVTQTAASLLPGVALLDLGEHRLKDLPAPEGLLQAGDGRFPPPRSLNAVRLPVAATPLLGREANVREAAAALRDGTRLLTLTGTGGAGKTRLALAVAADAAGAFPDGVLFADLAPVVGSDDVAAAIAAVLPGTVRAGEAAAALAAQVAGRRMLLVLDNFEHVLDAAPLVADLLAAAPALAVLATSRAPLNLRGEVEHAVEPLDDEAARALFRARASDGGARLGTDDEAAVAEVCRLLDGLPLAIELAAARARLLGPRGLAERLGHRLEVLTGGPRDAPERQRTLRATVEWSHRGLDPTAQHVFRRLAVFSGGASLEAAEAVCGPETLEGLAALVDASLLRRVEDPDGGARFAMLETLREFAAERLATDDNAGEAADRHAAYFLVLAERLYPQQYNAEHPRMRARLRREIDNFRAAHDRLLVTDPERAMRLISSAVWSYWELVGPLTEGRRRLAATLAAASGPPLARGRALFGAARLALLVGDVDAAGPLAAEAVALLRDAGDPRALPLAVSHAAAAASMRGEYAAALGGEEEALAIARASGDDWAIAMALNNLGDFVAAQDPSRAARLFEESLAHRLRSGDPRGVVLARANLADVALQAGSLDEAEARATAAADDARALGDNQLGAWIATQLAAVAFLRGDAGSARQRTAAAAALHAQVGEARTTATLLLLRAALTADDDPRWAATACGAADVLLERLTPQPWHFEVQARAQAGRAAREALGDDGFASALAAGRASDADALLAEGLAG
ncbi:MAG: hypothetical protein QOE86_2557 [Solirubrobacteraceae bacterium]|nr:hypothetical protein [Solirubrobacteraceae bacterium]